MGKVVKVKILKVDMHFGHGVLMSKHILSLNVDSFDLGSLRSKHKLELNVDTFDLGALRSKYKLELNVESFVGNFFQAN